MATLNTSLAGIGVVVEGKRQRAKGEPHESPRMAAVGASIIVAQLCDTRRFDASSTSIQPTPSIMLRYGDIYARSTRRYGCTYLTHYAQLFSPRG